MILKYQLVRSYLKIDSGLIIDYFNMYNNTKTIRNNYNPVQNELEEETPQHTAPSTEDTLTGVELSSKRNHTKMSKPVESPPPLVITSFQNKLSALQHFLSYLYPCISGRKDSLMLILKILTNTSKEKTAALFRKHLAKIEIQSIRKEDK